MKKVVFLIVAIAICIGLCACAKTVDASDANNFVGTWVNENKRGEPWSFRLLEGGKVILFEGRYAQYTSSESFEEINAVSDSSWADAGEWVLDDGKIIIFYTDNNSGRDLAAIFKINSDGSLEKDMVTYQKAD